MARPGAARFTLSDMDGDAGALGAVASAPDLRPQQFSPDNAQSSVNLYRGAVALPVTLVSVSGPNGLRFTVSALYGSNVERQINTSNETAPTGVVGVGWSLSNEAIVSSFGAIPAANDEYYLRTSGAVMRLLRAGASGSSVAFEPEEYRNWKISYFPNRDNPAGERWEVVREDGTTYVYGLDGIEWGVAWRRWIDGGVSPGGRQFPLAWNLVGIRTRQGNTVSLGYEIVNVPIGAGPAAYTRCARLTSVVDSFGQRVTLVYADKEPFELRPPHAPVSGVVAFQDRYDDKYLARIDTHNENGDLLQTAALQYAFYNLSRHAPDDSYKKRYLTAINGTNWMGVSTPPSIFTYVTDASQPAAGSLASVLHPQGALVSYAYTPIVLASAVHRVQIQRPAPGYTPRVWHGPGYIVVTWCGPAEVSCQILSWSGTWHQATLTWTWPAVADTLRVYPANGFLVVSYKDQRQGSYRVWIVRGDPYRFGNWHAPSEVTLASGATAPSIAVGPDFAVVTDPAGGATKVLRWDLAGGDWRETSLSLADADCAAVVTGEEWIGIVSYVTGEARLYVDLYYLADDGSWRHGGGYDEIVTIDWTYTEADTVASAGPAHLALTFIENVDQTAKIATYGTRLFTWDDRYALSVPIKNEDTQSTDLDNPVLYSLTGGSVVANAHNLARFDGSAWHRSTACKPTDGYAYSYAVDADVVATAVKDADGHVSFLRSEYDVYQQKWKPPVSEQETVEAGGARATPAMSGGIRTCGYSLYRRRPDGTWLKIGELPHDTNLDSLRNRAPGFITFESQSAGGTTVLVLREGDITETAQLTGERILVADAKAGMELCGPDAFVTYLGADLSTSSMLNLYRPVNGTLQTQLKTSVVTRASLDTGFGPADGQDVEKRTIDSYFSYESETATFDPAGLVAQFVRTRTTTGDPGGADGWIETVHFNGLNPDWPGAIYPDPDEYNNARDFFGVLDGQTYQQTTYDGTGRPVSVDRNSFYVYTRRDAPYSFLGVLPGTRKTETATTGVVFTAAAALAPALDQGTIPDALLTQFAGAGFNVDEPRVSIGVKGTWWTIEDRNKATFHAALEDGELRVYGWLTAAHVSTYNSKGQVAAMSASHYNSDGVLETTNTRMTFAWEVYPALEAQNVCTPTAEVASDVNGTPIGVRTTTFAHWPDADLWLERKSFLWTGDTRSLPFDFTRWSGDDDPPDGWQKTGASLAVTADGQTRVTADAGGISGGTLYDAAARLVVATFANCNHAAGEASFCGFERYEDPQGWALAPASLDRDAYICAGDCFTGTRRLSIPGDARNPVGFGATFAPAHANRRFVLSCWYKTAPGFVADPSRAGWRIDVTDANGAVTTRTIPLDDTADAWKHFYASIDPAAMGVSDARQIAVEVFSCQDGKLLLVDDIFFLPLQANGDAIVYDPRDRSIVARLNAEGHVRRVFHDYLRRPVMTADADGTALSGTAAYAWRQAHPDSFDPADPNSTLIVAARAAGPCSDFRGGDEWRRSWTASDGWSTGSSVLTFAGAGEGTLAPASLPNHAYVLRIHLAPDASRGAALGVRVGDVCSVVRRDGPWQLVDTHGTIIASASPSVMDSYDLLLSVDGGRLLFVVNGQLILSHAFDSALGAPVFFTDGPVGLAWIALVPDPSLRLVFSNNRDHPMQTQHIGDAGIRVAETRYDRCGRGYLTTKSVASDALPGYRPAFSAPLQADGSMGRCEVTASHPDAEGFPFSRERYESSPLGRAIEVGQPGRDQAIRPGSRQTARITYGLNVHDPDLADLPLPAGQYITLSLSDADGMRRTILKDQRDREIVRRDGIPGRETALTRTRLDALGHPVETRLPNYFDPTRGDRASFVETRVFDFQSNVLEHHRPDTAAPVRAVYDTVGRLRFHQTARGAADDYVNYRCFDSLGRLIESGVCENTTWDAAALHAHADDPAWRPAAGRWTSRYTFDGDGSDPTQAGRLIRTEARGDTSTADYDVRRIMQYDIEGRVVALTQQVPAFDGGQPQTVRYSYLPTGILSGVSTADVDISYARNRFGELSEVAVTASGRRRVIARYEYGADGLTGEILDPDESQPLRRTRRYGPAGWLTSIADPVFSETYAYSPGGRTTRAASAFSNVPLGGFVASHTYDYGYDALARVVSAKSSVDPAWTLLRTFDANGNTLTENGVAVDYYQGTNHLKGAAQGQTSYGYDDDGNMTSAAGQVDALGYDRANGMLTNASAGGGRFAAVHDTARERVLKTWNDTRKLYLWDPSGAVLLTRTTGGGADAVDYVLRGAAGTAALMRGGEVYHLLGARLGSVRAVYGGGRTTAAYNYLPFGGFMGPAFESPGALLSPYLFAGHEADRELGLGNFRARMYHPLLGRFTSIDPLDQFATPYLYAAADPINIFDPTGLMSLTDLFYGLGGFLLGIGILMTGGVLLGLGATAIIASAVMIGAGAAALSYTAMHSSDQEFNPAHALLATFIGGVAGLASLGAGAAVTAAAPWGIGAFFGDVAANAAIGAIDAYTQSAIDGTASGSAALTGMAWGIGGGLVMAGIGRAGALLSKRLVAAARRLPAAARGDVEVGYYQAVDPMGAPQGSGHSLIRVRGEYNDRLYDVLTRKLRMHNIRDANPAFMARSWAPAQKTLVSIPLRNATDAAAWAGQRWAFQDFGAYQQGWTDCTQWARAVMRKAGLHPPPWASTPKLLEYWTSTLH